jgi:hypothetical protein
MIYRIKQISENEFIPQCGGLLEWIFGYMQGLDKDSIFTWSEVKYQKKYCIVNSLEEAKEIIKKDKFRRNPNKCPKGYPKYHKP